MRFTAGSALLALLSLATLAIAAPLPDGGSAFTGAGGQAVGGSHNINDYANGVGRIDTLNIDRGNAGNGGKATSGTAVGGVGHKWVTPLGLACDSRRMASITELTAAETGVVPTRVSAGTPTAATCKSALDPPAYEEWLCTALTSVTRITCPEAVWGATAGLRRTALEGSIRSTSERATRATAVSRTRGGILQTSYEVTYQR